LGTLGLAGLVAVVLTVLSFSIRSEKAAQLRTSIDGSKTSRIIHNAEDGLGLDLQRPAQVYGWVNKAGPATVESWHSSADESRREAWDIFLKDRASGKIPLDSAYKSVPPHGPDPWGCRLYYNHPYKLFFVRTAKTGSTTILENVLPSCTKRPELLHCLDRVADSEMSVGEVAALWNDYTAFTFTRNVWNRGISQYQYLVHFLKGNGTDEHGNKLQCERVTWDDFCRDPLLVGKVCRTDPKCCTKKWTHQDWHMVSVVAGSISIHVPIFLFVYQFF